MKIYLIERQLLRVKSYVVGRTYWVVSAESPKAIMEYFGFELVNQCYENYDVKLPRTAFTPKKEDQGLEVYRRGPIYLVIESFSEENVRFYISEADIFTCTPE